MTKQAALAGVRQYLDDGHFEQDLRRRVAFRSDSQDPAHASELLRYLVDEIQPLLQRLGFDCQVLRNPEAGGPFLIATRLEDPALTTVLSYGHGDVVPGYAEQWREGLAPWNLTLEGERWYGRGTADNKGQHSINLTALEQVLKARDGRLGSTSSCCSKWARKPALRGCASCARSTPSCCRPMCLSPPTARA